MSQSSIQFNKFKRKKLNLFIHIIYFSSLLSPSLILAEDRTELETITVIGKTIPFDRTHSSEKLSQEVINRVPAKHISELLQNASSVYSATSQQDPAMSVNIRGMQDYGRINMSIDGMRQNFQVSEHQQRNGVMYIDPSLISSVDITKGSSSKIGGAAAMGGIANFRTISAQDFLKEKKKIGGNVSLNSGNNGTKFIGSSAVAFGNERYNGLIALSRRYFDDYHPGKHGEIGKVIIGSDKDSSVDHFIKNHKVSYSGYDMNSVLAKLRVYITANQHLELEYLQTKTNSDIVTTLKTKNRDNPWNKTGESKITSKNTSLNYHFNSDSPFIDLKAKIYHVSNQADDLQYQSYPIGEIGTKVLLALQRLDPKQLSKNLSHEPLQSIKKTSTVGIQLENSSIFNINERSLISLNYGIESFKDKTKPTSNQVDQDPIISELPEQLMMTPKGIRDISSIFTQAEYNYDNQFKIGVGLRYDRYRLKGYTGMTIFRMNGLIPKEMPTYFNIDQKESKILPSLSISLKPNIEWLELFAHWSKGWRPPAISETLITGRPHASSGFELMWPNPYLKPEESINQEFGFSIFQDDFIVPNDTFAFKMTYYKTKVDNYMYMGTALLRPGIRRPITDLGNSAVVNALNTSKFEGMEYQLSYDSGSYYANINYTRPFGKNKFCHKRAFLGEAMMIPLIDGPVVCNQIFSTSKHSPSDTATITIGTRQLDQKLDIGAKMRYSKGLTQNEKDHFFDHYPADWEGYRVYDLYTSYIVNKNFSINASIENVTNRAYVIPLGDLFTYTLNRGRTFQFGIHYDF